jgi:predicted regulator of Ras-like GTPase activity (Roadblock/LC7/MglB family)
MTETSLERTLEQINREGSFEASILASNDGLPIATVPSSYDTDVTAAMVALLQRVARDTRDYVGMAPVDEVSVRASDHIRLVCRCFEVDGQEFILAVMIPKEQRYYRQLTNRAIRELRIAWRSMVED